MKEMNMLFVICFLVFPYVNTFRFNGQRKGRKCEEVRATVCLQQVHTAYNSTFFPNHLKHRSQVEAIMELNTFTPLLKVGCSRHLARFLCSLYIPYCDPGFVVMPCRNLCLHAMLGCQPIMQRFSFNWNFNCTEYPDSSESKMCLGAGITLDEYKPTKKGKPVVEGKEKVRAKKGWVSGKENETLNLLCPEGKVIHIKKVRPSSTSGCCPKASKEVVTAMCSGNSACRLAVSKNTLGGHCKNAVTKLSIRYRCVNNLKNAAPCAEP